MFDVLYRSSRTRVAEIARSLTPQQLDDRVSGTPEWTGRQVVAHVVGVASDISTGNLAGAPLPPWTAAQVAAREGRSVDELLDEWDQAGPVVEARLADRGASRLSVFDVMTHEADLREHFGLGRLPDDDVAAVLGSAVTGVVRNFAGPGTLVVRAGGQEWTGGDGEPRTVLTVEPYELFRGLISRRSRRQMLAWDWSGGIDPQELVDRLPAFGVREDDQPVPR